VEVKQTCSKINLKKAKEQLENGLNMFQENIPFSDSQNWNYIRVVYFAYAENKKSKGKKKVNKKTQENPHSSNIPKEAKPFENKCLKCQNFVIGPKTDLSQWWKELTKYVPQEEQQDDTYLNVLRFLLHQKYKQQDCTTTGQLVQDTTQTSNKIFKADTIMFWSKEQYKTFKDLKDKKVAFTSGFGTGKTILIRTKAKELIASGQNVVIVIFETTAEKTILRMEYEKLFHKENSLVKITSISGAKSNHFL
jgi:hypothetical protein